MPIIINDVQTEVTEPPPTSDAGREAGRPADALEPLSPLLKHRRLDNRLRERRARLTAN